MHAGAVCFAQPTAMLHELVERFRKFQDIVSSSVFFKSEYAPEKGLFPSLQEVWSHLNRMHPVSQEHTA